MATQSVPSVEEVTNSAIAKGGILAMAYFDIHGDSKEEIEGILVQTIGKLTGEQGVIYALGDIDRAIELGDGKFSAGAQVRILTDSFPSLVRICTLYSPVGVEILKPYEIKLDLAAAHTILNQAADASYAFMTTMLKKVMKPEDRKRLEEIIKKRAEIGKELMKTGGGEEGEKGPRRST